MTEITRFIEAAQRGNPQAAAELLPLVYEELRKLAAARMAGESPDHTLSGTALVHEAYLRLVGDHHFVDRGHFFRVAAEAMRRILIDHARQKHRPMHGGDRERIPLSTAEAAVRAPVAELLALDEVLDDFAARYPVNAELVKLRYFGGFTEEEAANALGISRATASRYWTFARAWLINTLDEKMNEF
jgi:RNA polymerase sigma factor (TIGR02999 family)